MSRSDHRVDLTRRGLLEGAAALGLGVVLGPSIARAQKSAVKLAFIGPLTGGTASNGLGGRNSFLLAVQERNADPRTKYHYETEVLDDECKPTVAVQAALKASSDPAIVAGVTHYCSVTAIATIDTYHKAGMPAMVWGAVLPEITYSHTYVEITRVNGTMINQNNVASDFAVKTLGFKTFELVNDTTNCGRSHTKLFREILQKAGSKVVMTQRTAKAKAAFREPSEAYGPFAYVAANLVIDAIEAVGPDRAKVAARLKRTKNATTIIGPVEFDEYGQNTVSLISKYVSQDGKWVLWEDSEYASGKRTLPGHKFKKM